MWCIFPSFIPTNDTSSLSSSPPRQKVPPSTQNYAAYVGLEDRKPGRFCVSGRPLSRFFSNANRLLCIYSEPVLLLYARDSPRAGGFSQFRAMYPKLTCSLAITNLKILCLHDACIIAGLGSIIPPSLNKLFCHDATASLSVTLAIISLPRCPSSQRGPTDVGSRGQRWRFFNRSSRGDEYGHCVETDVNMWTRSGTPTRESWFTR